MQSPSGLLRQLDEDRERLKSIQERTSQLLAEFESPGVSPALLRSHPIPDVLPGDSSESPSTPLAT